MDPFKCRRQLTVGGGDIRRKALDTALSLTAGAYQTSLVSYFSYRDLFPALMKVRS